MEYPKIETLFDRGEDFVVDTTKFRLPEFENIKRWHVTEKIDGTNVRVMYKTTGSPDNLGRVTFGGRTDDASMPTFLLNMLQETFTLEKLLAAFTPSAPNEVLEVVLYGEGYGPKINKGGNYRSQEQGVSFRLFDVRVGQWWLNWNNIEDVARKLDISTVPVLADAVGLDWLIGLVQEEFNSVVAEQERRVGFTAEGVVARTDPLLFTRKGERLMWKLKARDFRAGKKRG